MHIPQGIYYICILHSIYLKNSVNYILIIGLYDCEVLSKNPRSW